MRGVLTLTLLMLLTGCAGHKNPPRPAAPAVEVPVWYLHPPRNDAARLYGVGEGATMAEATRQALADLTERVAVEVKSRWHATERSVDDGAYESVFTERSRTVEAVGAAQPLSGYEIAQSARLAWDRYLVLARVSRDAVADALRRSVEEGLEGAAARTADAHDDPFSRYLAARQAAESLEALRPKALLLAHLSPGDAPLEKKVRTQSQTLRAAAQKARRRVRLCQKGPQTPFAQAASRFFEARGFLVSSGPGCSPSALRLAVTPNLHTDRLHGFFIVKGYATLALYAGDAPVLSRRFAVKGVSSKSEERALRQAAESFYETLLKDLSL